MASDLDGARALIEARFDANVTDAVAWGNAKFDPPDDAPWWRMRILWGDGQIETKNGRNLIAAVLSADYFVPADGRGLGAAMVVVDGVRDAFNRVKLTNVTFFAASGPRSVPQVQALRFESRPDLEWAQLNLSIPMRIDDT